MYFKSHKSLLKLSYIFFHRWRMMTPNDMEDEIPIPITAPMQSLDFRISFEEKQIQSLDKAMDLRGNLYRHRYSQGVDDSRGVTTLLEALIGKYFNSKFL